MGGAWGSSEASGQLSGKPRAGGGQASFPDTGRASQWTG